MVGGGVALGPKPRSYAQKTPKKMVRLALRSALSDRAAIERIALIDGFTWETPKTKDAISALETLGLTGKVLVVLGRDDEVARRSFRNLENVTLIPASDINPYDLIRADWVLFTDESLPSSEHTEATEEEVA